MIALHPNAELRGVAEEVERTVVPIMEVAHHQRTYFVAATVQPQPRGVPSEHAATPRAPSPCR